MKYSSRRSHLFRFCLVIEVCLLFSMATAFFYMKTVAWEENGSNPRLRHWHNLLQNYRAILLLMNSNPDDSSGNGSAAPPPCVENARLLETIGEALDRGAPSLELLGLIGRIEPIHPFFTSRKHEMLQRLNFQERNYREYIRGHTASETSQELKAFLVVSLLRTGKKKEAIAAFRELFARSPDTQLKEHFSGAEWLTLLSQLDEDFWASRLNYLQKRESRAELFRELRLAGRFTQLVNLYRAAFFYENKDWARCRQAAAQIKAEKYRLPAQKLILKADLRQGAVEDLRSRLDVFRSDAALRSSALFEAANLLYVDRRYEQALTLYRQFIEAAPWGDEDRWRSLWLMAWLQLRLGNRKEAERFFGEGAESPIFGYRVAAQYWAEKMGVANAGKIPPYPPTYYSMKTYGRELFSLASRRLFLEALNQGTSEYFARTVGLVVELVRGGHLDLALDMVSWTLSHPPLRKVDQKMLSICKSILLFKRKDFLRNWINFKNFVSADVPASLPTFLSNLFYPFSYSEIVGKYSRESLVDPLLVMAIIREESFFQPQAVSPARAHGLMQLLLDTAKKVAGELKIKISRQDLFDPEINVRLGIRYFRTLLDKYDGKVYLALAAYNAGDNRVDQWQLEFGAFPEEEFIEMIPFSQTRNYVKNIMLNYFLYKHYHEKC